MEMLPGRQASERRDLIQGDPNRPKWCEFLITLFLFSILQRRLGKFIMEQYTTEHRAQAVVNFVQRVCRRQCTGNRKQSGFRNTKQEKFATTWPFKRVAAENFAYHKNVSIRNSTCPRIEADTSNDLTVALLSHINNNLTVR
ncbi:uncharacterized protein LOC131801116 [Musca domestica]|uniref:Uncharacterized protein LOC131801116 n=1 Tax=Musca domestica TaxID=7370 RepID=A0ABM3UNU5_MUSDO|nr:uncharacterized protein LOC131801116 [Musca domestica]